MAMDAANLPAKLEQARGERSQVADALTSFATGTRQYLVVSTIFGFVVAVFDTAFLALTPVPVPLLWGLLAFITNYIPNIGFVIGLVPPAILALLEGGVDLMLVVIVVYSVVNFVIQSVIQPKFVGDAVGLAGTLTFLSLGFLGLDPGRRRGTARSPAVPAGEGGPRRRRPRLCAGSAQCFPAILGRRIACPMLLQWSRRDSARRLVARAVAAEAGSSGRRRGGGTGTPAPLSPEAATAADVEAALGRLPPRLRRWVAWLLSRYPGRILLGTAATCIRIELFDRSMTIAAQFFTSVLPLLILAVSWGGAC